MRRWRNAVVVSIGALALSGCFTQSQKFYTCQGDRLSYRSEFQSRNFKFEDFSLILRKKFSLSAMLKGEALYQIDGNVFPMNAETNDYKIYVEDKRWDAHFSFDLISKKMSYSARNAYRHTDFYEGRCVASEV